METPAGPACSGRSFIPHTWLKGLLCAALPSSAPLFCIERSSGKSGPPFLNQFLWPNHNSYGTWSYNNSLKLFLKLPEFWLISSFSFLEKNGMSKWHIHMCSCQLMAARSLSTASFPAEFCGFWKQDGAEGGVGGAASCVWTEILKGMRKIPFSVLSFPMSSHRLGSGFQSTLSHTLKLEEDGPSDTAPHGRAPGQAATHGGVTCLGSSYSLPPSEWHGHPGGPKDPGPRIW